MIAAIVCAILAWINFKVAAIEKNEGHMFWYNAHRLMGHFLTISVAAWIIITIWSMTQ